MGLDPFDFPFLLPIDDDGLGDGLSWSCSETLGRLNERPEVRDVLRGVYSVREPPQLERVVVNLIGNHVWSVVGAVELWGSDLTSEGHRGHPDLVAQAIGWGFVGFVPSLFHLVGFPTDVVPHLLQGFANQPSCDPSGFGDRPKGVLGESWGAMEVGKEGGFIRRRMNCPVDCHDGEGERVLPQRAVRRYGGY